MATRRDPHQQGETGSSLVPAFDVSAHLHGTPLLPYERDLIAIIGFSEEEYKWYKQEILLRIKERPAEYDLIPNVQNIEAAVLVPLLISLAVGLVTSAVSYLLMPKPKAARESASKRLADAQGRSRFNQTFGFEGSPDIAKYGSTIPLLFGRYTERETHTTGGLLASPALVWSRMFSYGSNQGYKGLYVIGESSVDAPDINGVFIGTVPAASLSPQLYAFYWASREGESRVRGNDLFAGTRGEPFSGDPEPHDDVFQCPTLAASVDTGFCAAYTPTGNTAFGVYSPIKNGNHNKINWAVVSVPGGRDSTNRLRATKRKIAGNTQKGMPGEGAGYSCFMGLIRHNNNEYDLPGRVGAQVNDSLTYRISDRRYTNEIFASESGVNLDDENARSIAEREDTDDRLQVGEIFMIGRTVWQVTQRPDRPWVIGKGDYDYTLRCIELTGGSNEIGIAGTRAITEQLGYVELQYKPQWLGPSYFPLLRVSFATVRNQRVVDATEIGIRSQVWNNANGLCNFPEIPTPEQLDQYDLAGISITNGTRNGYFARTSVFTIALRPVGLDTSGQPFPWELIGEQFCVTGQTPTNKYNYIRIKSRVPGQYEYRFIPKTGADVRQFSPDYAEFWRLNASGKQINGADYSNRYGTFRVTTTGDIVAAIDVRKNVELRSEGMPSSPSRFVTQAARLQVEEWLPANQTGGKFGGWHTHYLGLATSYKDQTRSINLTLSWAQGKTVTIRITAVSVSQPFNPLSGGYEWANPSTMTIIGWSHQPPENYVFEDMPFVNNRFTVGNVGPRLRVIHDSVFVPGNPAQGEREFEGASQIADVSHYQELDKSNANSPEHEIIYVNESVTNPETPSYNSMAMLGMALRTSRSITSLDQVRAWLPNGISTLRFATNTIGPANKFSDLVYFLLTDGRTGAGRRISPELVDTAGFYRTSLFLSQNKIYFDGVVEEPTNLREFIGQLAPLHLCNFVIANGKFTVEPALPTESDGTLNQGAVPISALFTAGNIIEDTFAVNYIEVGERQNFRAVMTYREGAKNQLPEQRSVMVLWADGTNEFNQANMETYDMSNFCTYREQAILTAQFLLSVRRRISHTISFRTTPEGLYLAPGNYIRVITKASPLSAYENGVIDGSGNVTSLAGTLSGTYNIFAYREGDADVRSATITINNGTTTDPSLFNSLFTVVSNQANANVYQVDQISMDEEGLVEIQASEFPCDANLRSIIVQDVLNPSRFTILD